MIEDRLYTTKELADLYGLSTRTVNNRLKFLRVKYPDCVVIKKLQNGIRRFYFKGSFLKHEMLSKRHYPERREFTKALTKAEREYAPPPRFVKDKDGRIYNYYSLRTLLTIVTNSSLLEKFMVLTVMFWVFIFVYVWSI